MIDANEISELLATYKKYGWELRRVLLTAALKGKVGEIFAEVAVTDSDLDAIWFSRPPKPGAVPWEIRHLSPTPYALVEHLDETDADFKTRLSDVEARLREAVAKRQTA